MVTIKINGKTIEFPGDSVTIENILNNAKDIEDRSELTNRNITIENIQGDLNIDASDLTNCNITIENIHGDLNIDASDLTNCDVTVKEVHGDFDIDDSDLTNCDVSTNRKR
ncbi:MAG: hypothetical protein IKN27_04195 [Selenomonadaceae bacterium]|nr:hypothetical protein [Selenomonadaceae bacterium]